MTDPVHRFEMPVPDDVVDANRHVNNVAYVQWMQDAATRHSDAVGCTKATADIGAAWVVRAHRIEYLNAALPGDMIRILTWVSNFRRVRSLRKYKFIRSSDQAVLATGETDWVFIDATTGRPRSIPDHIINAFQTVPPDAEP